MSVTTMPPDVDAVEGTAEPKKKSKKKLLIVLVLILAIAGAGWWFVLRPAPDKEPVPGEVVALEPIQVNLAGGHYLKIGIALQASADVHEALDGSKALDSTIELFSGMPMERMSQPIQRKRLKDRLLEKLDERYHGEVLDVYFTDFVTQ